MLQEDVAVIRDLDAAAMARDQARADGFLQVLDRLGDGGRRDADGGGRCHDLPGFRGCDEVADLADVEAHGTPDAFSDFPKF
jgi:hypothetical protein